MRVILTVVISSYLTATLGAQVVINEIHYAPEDRTVPEEFVELYNNSDTAVNISGWYLSSGVEFTFSDPTWIGPREYLVVAQDPDVIVARYGAVPAVGPFSGRLDNQGEQLILRRRDGGREDEVDYRRRFPWPIVGGPPGYSTELVHPDLDNDLGGSWRPSDPGLDTSRNLVRTGTSWRYRKGTQEASTPSGAWREALYDDSGWLRGTAPIGYGEGFVETLLGDMRGSYTTVYLRKTFDVDDVSTVGNLVLEVQYDDGFNAWVNGVHVAGANVPSAELDHDDTSSGTREEHDFEAFPLPPPAGYLVEGTNVLAIQLHNASLGNSSDAFVDARLTAGAAGAGPTPGAQNSVFATQIAPHMRQVKHEPQAPGSGQFVLITVKVTDDDGVGGVFLDYQLVEPGAYIRLTDPEYDSNWTRVEMNDAGFGGDAVSQDEVYSVLMPRDVQVHRRLVRYRITAVDSLGTTITAPYPEDPQPNFAYFVHDGVPEWIGSARPGVAPSRTYASDLLSSVPVYHLITRRLDHLNAMHVPYRWRSPDQEVPTMGEHWGSDYRWLGTLVYEGEVYDHIRYRARGGVWRYSMGKNMWKFDFNRGHSFEARDDYGREYESTWDKLNFSAIIQQGNFEQRGEQGLFEAAGFKLHNLANNAAPKTHFVHFRIVEDTDEMGPDQFSGDFRGLYLVLEQMDGRFLDEHHLPDGNLYKMEGGTGELNNQGLTQPSDKSDLNLFLNTYRNGSPSATWWRNNLDLDDYYSFRAIAMAIHDYDMHAGKNYFYYNNPETGKWSVFNWDIDLCWTTTYNGGGGRGPLNEYVLDPFPQFQLEYRNRMRELRDLLFNWEQTGMLIEEMAAVVFTPGQRSFVDADRAMWDYNPILVSSYINDRKAGHGRFYENAPTRDFPGMIGIMKDYVLSRAQWIDTTITQDPEIPNRPIVAPAGQPGYPIDELRFRVSEFRDPQGNNTFGALKWRAAEVPPGGTSPFDHPFPILYEIQATWESEELRNYQSEILVPPDALKIGHTYRVRARLMDNTGRWSHWSNAVQFTAAEPTEPFPQQDYLRVSEIMYNPPGGVDYEFVELQNTGPDWLDLTSVSLREGIEFQFASSEVTGIGPGEYVVVVKNEVVFRSTYDTANITIAGEFSGRLGNGGEIIALVYGGNATILEFGYSDEWYPTTDGGGRSLVIVDPLDPPVVWSERISWRASEEIGGSPGASDGDGPPPSGRQLPGDGNQDGRLDVSDAISLLMRLFQGGLPLPCEGEGVSQGGNRSLLDVNGDDGVDMSDAVYLLDYIFKFGPPPALGTGCVRIQGCPNVCGL